MKKLEMSASIDGFWRTIPENVVLQIQCPSPDHVAVANLTLAELLRAGMPCCLERCHCRLCDTRDTASRYCERTMVCIGVVVSAMTKSSLNSGFTA